MINEKIYKLKIENNGTSSNARVQASVLSLYDSARLRHPLIDNKEADWSIVDKEIREKLVNIKSGKISFLTSSLLSLSTISSNVLQKLYKEEHLLKTSFDKKKLAQ